MHREKKEERKQKKLSFEAWIRMKITPEFGSEIELGRMPKRYSGDYCYAEILVKRGCQWMLNYYLTVSHRFTNYRI